MPKIKHPKGYFPEYLMSERLRHEYFAISWFLKFGRTLGGVVAIEFPYVLKENPKKLESRMTGLRKRILSLEVRMQKKAGWKESRLLDDLTIRP
jgi:hypothetical protein